ncbi:hypothetical protein [Streptomyces iconiensis]|uniref:CDP-Glycerol:Poly(Glycerophosphate) glycerophosphotransferase n=1 Tax=Streptomyces iconiensis TaxID=1384038 RepID=A0ABT6ZYI5_9ACTN|nr:hypothetical protein [Streptomyces iconiensis]MDJ1133468.1 hypothetical protein [Streptomyces iconiensis]
MGSADPPAVRVPVGPDAERWVSREAPRRVLLVVHNVTSAGRLLDVLPLFHDDFRVQLLVTSTESSAFQSGIHELFGELGLPVLPWEQAVSTPVDLAISASFGGQLHLIKGELAVLSHGVGYTKRLASREPGAGSREPGAGSREPGAGSREPGAGSREPTFGLAPDWLLVDGVPFVDALVLSHPEQLSRLRRACPETAGSAVLAGDPCYDRMLAGSPYRQRYRRALGVRRGQRLVVLNSTWNPEGFFGNGGGADLLPSLLPRLAAELPADDYRVAAVLHPNIWYGHGPGQVRAWLDRARRNGLTLVDPLHAWRQALLAADIVVGDFGAVSYYSAALGIPVLLAAAGQERLDPEAPLADFVRTAPRLDPHAALREQLERALAAHRPLTGPAEFTSSAPGESAALLRRSFYALLGLSEPPTPALLEPLALPPYEPPRRTAPLHVRTWVRGRRVRVERSAEHPYGASGETHLAAHEDTRDPGDLAVADVIVREGERNDPRLGGPAAWAAEVLNRYPQCALAAYVTGPDTCTVHAREHGLLQLSGVADADADPAAYASALHAWLAGGRSLPPGGTTLLLRAAGRTHPVRVESATGPPRSGTAGS